MDEFTKWDDAGGTDYTAWDDAPGGANETQWDLLPSILGRTITVIWESVARRVEWS